MSAGILKCLNKCQLQQQEKKECEIETVEHVDCNRDADTFIGGILDDRDVDLVHGAIRMTHISYLVTQSSL